MRASTTSSGAALSCPGDTLVMEMELTAFKARFGLVKMKGSCYVDGKKVVEGDFQFAMVK